MVSLLKAFWEFISQTDEAPYGFPSVEAALEFYDNYPV